MMTVVCEGCRFFDGMDIHITNKAGVVHEEGFCQNREVREAQLIKKGVVLWGQGTLDGRGQPMRRLSKTPRKCEHRREEG